MQKPVTHFSPELLSKLGFRLQAIYDLIVSLDYYDNIWDCCCDHGYLGVQLLNNKLCDTLYFVDQIPHLIEHLDSKLKRFPPGTYKAITADAGELEFVKTKSHLVILAGVGGEHIVDILKSINTNNPGQQIDYLFCPSTTQYDLREFLSTQNFTLQYESIVTERNRSYEIILVKGFPENRVSTTGKMWDINNPDHQKYLSKLIHHYENRMRNDKSGRSERILEEYRNIGL